MKKKGVYVRIPIPLLQRVEKFAEKEGVTISEAIRLLIREALKNVKHHEEVLVCG